MPVPAPSSASPTQPSPADASNPAALDTAQDGTQAEPITGQADEIVVTGFRESLRAALTAKRLSNVQVDQINSEDIAKTPDTNLAEALQRLPGVSIERDNGEGRTITVRGLGGNFNRTRINGLEALSTAGSNEQGGSGNRTREFDYNTFASELFSTLRVQKSPSAETDEGSLGATIDLVTARPLDYKEKTVVALGAEDSYYDNANKHNPRLTGLISQQLFGGKVGILLSGAYSKANNRQDSYQRQAGAADYVYRGNDFAGNENPQRAGFAAPAGTVLTGITNAQIQQLQTGSNPAAYAQLYPGAPYNTPGRFDDSTIRIPAFPTLATTRVRNNRIGLTGSIQFRPTDRTTISVDGLYSRFKSTNTTQNLLPIALNRNNTNATLNTAPNTGGALAPGAGLTPAAARALYPNLCVPSAGDQFTRPLDCGQQLYGTTPAFSTALNQNGQLVPSVLGTGAVVPGAATPANANIFSVNPFNLDPYDYYNNPNSVGYIPSTNRLAFRGQMIGRPAVRVVDAEVEDGIAKYLKLQNVDFRASADEGSYVTEFKQGTIDIQQEMSDNFKGSFLYGRSRSTNVLVGRLVEFNRLDSPGDFVFDERGGGKMPLVDFGFDTANPANWGVVKAYSSFAHSITETRNSYDGGKIDFDWQFDPQLSLAFGGYYRTFGFSTTRAGRNNTINNPTLLEAGSTTADAGELVQFGQGLQVPAGGVTSFFAPNLDKFSQIIGFDCRCINKYGDFRVTPSASGSDNFQVTETSVGAYAQIDYNIDLLGRPLRGNVGVRYADTDLESRGNSTAGRPIVGRNNYGDWLPSINVNYEVTRSLVLRAAASKVIARPLLGNLSPTVSAISVPTTGDVGGTLTVGNPQLNPFRSTNVDLSAEWYFRPGAVLAVAAYNKDISSFPQTVLTTGTLTSLVGATSVDAILQGFGAGTPQAIYINGGAGIFTARQFQDAPGGYIRGIEINAQMDFNFLPGFLKNFGAQINYTHIESELNYVLDPGTGSTPRTLGKAPFLGVSPDAINGALYYETPLFRIRAAGSYRKGYSRTYPIAGGSCAAGLIPPLPTNPAAAGTICNSPLINDFVFQRDTFNLDVTGSVNITDNISIVASALNLTNQPDERYAYTGQDAVNLYQSSGVIYRLGARVRF